MSVIITLRYSILLARSGQGEAFADMATGGMLALGSIYVILAWGKPAGAILARDDYDPLWSDRRGGWSLCYGAEFEYSVRVSRFVALSGIVVNNSIILVATIERRRAELEENETEEDAVVQGTIDRLRPVLLTSMTTIGCCQRLCLKHRFRRNS